MTHHKFFFETPALPRRLDVMQLPPYLVLRPLSDGTSEQQPDVCILFFKCPRVSLLFEDSKNYLCISNIHLAAINIQKHLQPITSEGGGVNKLLRFREYFSNRTASNLLHELFQIWAMFLYSSLLSCS